MTAKKAALGELRPEHTASLAMNAVTSMGVSCGSNADGGDVRPIERSSHLHNFVFECFPCGTMTQCECGTCSHCGTDCGGFEGDADYYESLREFERQKRGRRIGRRYRR
jgi:hypothetical protein